MSERDPELEKLYREHSREEPSSALDAKILAAAHRAVDSGPRKPGAAATRPQRWWMPLAAAATIGVIAIGIVEYMPQETAIDVTSDATAPHPGPLPASGERESDKAAASAMQPAPAQAPTTQPATAQAPTTQPATAQAPTTQPAPPRAPTTQPPPGQAPVAPPAPAQAPATQAAPAPSAGVAPAAPSATQQPPPAPAPITQRAPPPSRAQAPAATMDQRKASADDGARARKQMEAPAAAPPPPAPAAKPAMPQSAPPPPAREKFAAEPVPFPAAPAPAPAERKTEVTSADAAKRDAPAGQPMAELRKDSVPRHAGAAMAPRPPPPPAPAAAPTPAPAPAPAPASGFAGRSRLSSEAAGNVAQSQHFEQEMQTLARDPDAWIARIRKLRDEGNAAQALRELREFRALVPDAERKLPADLKTLQP